MVLKETLASGTMVAFAVAAAVAVGAGCFTPPQVTGGFCCTKGDASSAYLTTLQSCPTGFRAISSTDRQNASLYATCRALPRPVRAVPLGADAAAPAAPRSCFAECPQGAQNGHCVIAGAMAPAYGAPLAQIAVTLTRDRNARIEPAALTRLFQIAARAPQRGAIVVRNEHLTNSGAPAVLQADLPALRTSARLEFPAAIDTAIERRGAVTIFRLAPVANSVSMRLLNPLNNAPHPLDASAGGRVLAIETDGRTVFMQMASSCVAATLPALP